MGLIAAASFFRSPVFSVIPNLVGDYYRTSHDSENCTLLYSSKLWGVVGETIITAAIVRLGWHPTFLLGAGLLVVAAAATVSLRPGDPST